MESLKNKKGDQKMKNLITILILAALTACNAADLTNAPAATTDGQSAATKSAASATPVVSTAHQFCIPTSITGNFIGAGVPAGVVQEFTNCSTAGRIGYFGHMVWHCNGNNAGSAGDQFAMNLGLDDYFSATYDWNDLNTTHSHVSISASGTSPIADPNNVWVGTRGIYIEAWDKDLTFTGLCSQ